MRRMVKRTLSALLALAMCMSLVAPNAMALDAGAAQSQPLATTFTGDVYAPAETGRQHINFNREWKFKSQKVTDNEPPDFGGGANTVFDDSAWAAVGLPHSFSIPYNMETSFFVGYGMYRKTFTVPEEWLTSGKRVSIEFEGAFIETEVFVNGQASGTHLGGYTGFTFDITDKLHAGENVIAVRVNNKWRADQAPRSGDHQFSGGIYRDVYLNVTDSTHVTWYGTFVTTPALDNPGFDEKGEDGALYYDYANIDETSYLSWEEVQSNVDAKRSNVRVQTELRNDSAEPRTVRLRQEVVDNADCTVVASFQSGDTVIPANTTQTVDMTSEMIQGIKLWSPEDPALYTVYTTVLDASGAAIDSYESPLGFRWAQFRNDGFYLNGEKTVLFGANVHQDHAGWGDAVTNEGFLRDVGMVKEAGMNFIRGSHYPHDPSFATDCDEAGILFWSEMNLWGMGGDPDPVPTYTSSDWGGCAGYPLTEAPREKFEESCMRGLEEMIRINRNHPSIVIWSMGNEIFFPFTQNSSAENIQLRKDLVNDMRNLAHQLDPTRKAGLGGAQREGFDTLEISDVAGYNGDGGNAELPRPGGSLPGNMTQYMPSISAEYGSHTSNRGQSNDEFRPYFDAMQNGSNIYDYILKGNRAGLTLWCAFHHGSVGGSGLANMGFIDYSRLPLRAWYWYRETYTGVPDEHSIEGTGVGLTLKASQTTIPNDGTGDTHLIVTVVDKDGNWVNEAPTVTLTVLEGPGVFPTGKTMKLPGGSLMRDGRGATEFRSYYSGTTIIEASAPGLGATEITITTTATQPEYGRTEPEDFLVVPKEEGGDKLPDAGKYAADKLGHPTFPSSGGNGGAANDGDTATKWTAETAGPGQYWMQDTEYAMHMYKLKLEFDGTPYPYKVEVANDKGGPWAEIAAYTAATVENRPYEEELGGIRARYVKVSFTDVPEGEFAFLNEATVYGITAQGAADENAEYGYVTDTAYVSDLTPDKAITQGWAGKQPGIDRSIEGKPITVDGVVYGKGLGLHAASEAVYTLDGKYSRFQAVAGIDDEVGGPGDAIFRVYATVSEGGEDTEKLIYEMQVTSGGAQPVDVSVRGAKKLRLVTDPNGANGNDHTDWADAKLLGAVRDISKTDGAFTANITGNSAGMKAGEDLVVTAEVRNPGTRVFGQMALALHDQTGALREVLVSPRTSLMKGQNTSITLTMPVPESIQPGWEVRADIYNADTLVLLGQTTHFGVQTPGSAAVQMRIAEPAVPLAAEAGVDRLSAGWVKVDVTTTDGTGMARQGSWQNWSEKDPSKGGYQNTELFIGDGTPIGEGDHFSYTFTGTKLKVGGVYGYSQTNAKVLVDGVEVGETNSHAPQDTTQRFDVIWTSEDLTAGEHTVKLVPTGKFSLDYFEYQTDSGAGTPEEVWEEVFAKADDARITKQGNWKVWETSSAHSGGEYYIGDGEAIQPGDHIQLTFTGTQVKVYGKRDGSQVDATVILDGVEQSVKTHSKKVGGETEGYFPVWETEDLIYGEHTIKLVPNGKLGLDYFSYQSADTDPSAVDWVKVDGEAETGVSKVGDWAVWSSANAYMETETFIGDNEHPLVEGDHISCTFEGIQVSVCAKVDGSTVGANVYIDDVPSGFIRTYEADKANQGYKLVWNSAVLTPGEHTIKLVPTGKFGLDYFDTLAEGGERRTRVPTVDKSELAAQIADADNRNAADYSAESWEAMQAVLTAAKAVRDRTKPEAIQAEVDQAAENLAAALADLVEYQRPSMAALVTAMEDTLTFIERDDAVNYVTAPVAEAFAEAYALYRAVQPAGENVTAAAQRLQDALDGLERRIRVTGVTLSPESVLRYSNTGDKTAQLTAAVVPDNADDQAVSWGTSDPTVATVDQTGLVTVYANGTATITVTTEDGGHTAECTVTVETYPEEPAKSGEKKILSFTIENQVGDAVIDEVDHTIAVTMPAGADVTALTPTIAVSEKAAVDPASGAVRDFTAPVVYSVTAEDGTTQTYTVMVTVKDAPVPERHTVTFETGGGSDIACVTVEDGETVAKPADPIKSGYDFAGWYTDEALMKAYDFESAVTADLTLYAKWEEQEEEPHYAPPSNTTTKTEKNKDGSTTKTVTNKKTGNVVATTTYSDGTKIVATTPKDGETTIEVSIPKGTSEVTVTIPTTEQLKSGEVAVIVREDGEREVVKTSVSTEAGLRVTLDESCKLEIVDNSKTFADVASDHWAADAIAFVTSRELFAGGDGGFQPAGGMSRAMLFTVLARLDGQDTTTGETWYSAAMDWAKETGISDGTAPEQSITRESLAVMLYRYAGSPEADDERRDEVIAPYPDAANMSDWATDAMLWAVECGIITGSNGKLNPGGTATRAEVAAMLQRFLTR